MGDVVHVAFRRAAMRRAMQACEYPVFFDSIAPKSGWRTWGAVAASEWTKERQMEPYVEFYEDEAGEYRWRLKAANHELIAESGEGYTDKYNARRAFNTVRVAMQAVQEEKAT